VALLLSVAVPWASQFREQIGGANTAPLYIRITGLPKTIDDSDLASQFLADSTSTGNPANPELVAVVSSDSNRQILRWRWVLISNLRISKQSDKKMFDAAGITLEYAYDSTCDNESGDLPDSLVWRRLSLPAHSSTTGSLELEVPPLSDSLVPHHSIREALNWGGDLRAVTHSFPAAQLPWSLYLLGALLFSGFWLVSAMRAHPTVEPDVGRVEAAGNRPLRDYWPSLVVFAVFVALVFSAMPVYDVNDDQRMIAMLAGHWQLPAGPRPLFMSVTLGWPLQLLYSVAPTVPWYGFMLEGGLLGALFVIALAGTRFLSPLGHGIGFALFLVFVGFLPAIRPTFSVVAAIACAAAAFGMFSLLLRSAPGRRYSAGLLIASALLAVFASFLRFGAFAITVVVLSPAVLLLSTRLRDSEFRARAFRAAVALGIATFFVVAGRFVEHVAYSSAPAWSDWKEENRVRGRALDWSKPEHYINEAKALPLTSSEREMLSHHFLLDSRLADSATLAELARQAAAAHTRARQSFAQLYKDANRIVRQLPQTDPAYGNPLLLVIFIAGSALLAFLFEQDRRARALPFFALLWSLALIVALALLTKPVPYRISYGMLFPAGVIASLGLARLVDRGRRSSRSSTVLVSAGLVVVALPALVHHLDEVSLRRQRSGELRNEMRALAASGERDVVLHYLPSYAFPVLSPHPQFAPVRIHDTGYLATTPVAARARSEAGFADLPDLLDKRDRVLFLAANPDHTIYGPGASQSDLESYLGERFNTKVSVSVERQHYHWTWLQLNAPAADP